MCEQICSSVDEIIPFSLIEVADLMQDVRFGISLNHISTKYSGHHCLLGIMLQAFSQFHLSPSISLYTKHITRTRYLYSKLNVYSIKVIYVRSM